MMDNLPFPTLAGSPQRGFKKRVIRKIEAFDKNKYEGRDGDTDTDDDPVDGGISDDSDGVVEIDNE